MKNISIFKISRHFFALFFLMTVLPLLSLVLWSNHDLEQNIAKHQQHFIEVITADMLGLYQSHLSNEAQEVVHILQGSSPSIKQIKTLLNAKEVWTLDSTEAQRFLKQHPEGPALLALAKQQKERVVGTYFIEGKQLECLLLAPVSSGQVGLLITKVVPVDTLFPKGPVELELYKGNTVQPGQRIAHSRPHRRPWSDRFGKPPDKPMGSRGPILEKVVLIQSLDHLPVLTIKIRLMPPPAIAGNIWEGLHRWIGALILLTGFVSSIVAGKYIHRNFIEPLLRLSLATQKVQSGQLQARVETDQIKQADVRQTLESFNQMLDGLAEKEQLRNSFISNLTHDFRTPLIAQSRSLELLSKEFHQLGLVSQEELAHSLINNTEHLLMMVNQLLETYQAEAGMFTPIFQGALLPCIVSQCFEQLTVLAEDRQIQLSQSFSSDFPKLETDAHFLKRILINLIGNAIQNIPKGSHIQVLGQITSEDSVEVRVRDNGYGISLEEQDRLFDRYYAGTGDTRKLGSGLGLYICKVLVTALQGSIHVESNQQEHFTDFVITLPRF